MTTERDCKHGQLARSCNVCELESEVARQAAETERLKAEVQAKSDVLSGSLKAQVEKDALLRQALDALSDFDYDKRMAAIAAIKQHLGGQSD